jgi:hypothetical protein
VSKKKEDEIPMYSGKALEIRFPDIIMEDEKGRKFKKQLHFITFPDWIHEIYIGDKVYKVLGKDLQIAMPISMGGAIFPIIELKEQYYHGVVLNEEHPIGYPGDITEIKKYSFKRLVKKNVDYWVVEEIKYDPEDSNPELSSKELSKWEKNDLINYIIHLQDNFTEIKIKYDEALENLHAYQDQDEDE